MKAISFPNPIFSGPRCHHLCFKTTALHYQTKSFVVGAGRGTDGKRSIVDENMIVLRMRIHEVEMGEMEGLPPEMSRNWMEWEKNYYEHYNRDVCEAMKVIQMCLMNTRPSLALGALTLLMLSVPLSTGVVIYNFISMVKSIL
ncbi:hypothetical protein L2E82_18614 [Cichorium intybus]|uniref:Uncharacterized protein n=1 Tax=Cichorium intybus TaxID=13427 RepID=A0ACB9FBV7_CICIN|nr:hypothetical protein L2E82_18614 [Cichorium intybus]